jgi:ferredoxin
MTAEIYFFSGTGNSYYVASTIGQRLNAEVKPIIPLLKKENIVSKADMIGLVFPIYDFKAPDILYEFIKKLRTPSNTYFFAICTYGIMPLKTMKKLEMVFHSNNKKLSAGYTIKMPHNGLGYTSIPLDKQKRMFNIFEEKKNSIVQDVTSQKLDHMENSGIIDHIILLGIFVRLLPNVLPMFKQALLKGWDSLGFYADDTCNSCGICQKICPVDNIELIDDKPVWSDRCLNCFACFHWCPQRSIQIADLTRKMQRYHHPLVKLSDIILQKQGSH